MAEASGRVSLRAGERRHSPFIRQRRQKAMSARIRGKSLSAIAREGFLDRRSKRCFWLLLSPQTKVARAGARNYPRRRQILRLRRCVATPHPPPSGAPSPQGEGLRVRHLATRAHQGEGLGDKKKRPGALLLALFIAFWRCRSGRSETGATGRRRGLRRGRRSWGPRWAAPRAGRSSSRRFGVFPPTWPADAGDASPAY